MTCYNSFGKSSECIWVFWVCENSDDTCNKCFPFNKEIVGLGKLYFILGINIFVVPITNVELVLKGIMECARYRPLCQVRLLWGIWASKDFSMGNQTGTMACTQHTP
jgi:hypothetical protein